MPAKLTRSELDARFWAKVTKTETCWLWAGAKAAGYGVIRRSRRSIKAHRYTWELTNGPIPDGLFACHTCDVRACVNPAHLFLGTNGDNQRDSVAKGRHIGQNKTHCIRGHELAGENLHPYYFKNFRQRKCLTCIRAASAATMRKRRAAA